MNRGSITLINLPEIYSEAASKETLTRRNRRKIIKFFQILKDNEDSINDCLYIEDYSFGYYITIERKKDPLLNIFIGGNPYLRNSMEYSMGRYCKTVSIYDDNIFKFVKETYDELSNKLVVPIILE